MKALNASELLAFTRLILRCVSPRFLKMKEKKEMPFYNVWDLTGHPNLTKKSIPTAAWRVSGASVGAGGGARAPAPPGRPCWREFASCTFLGGADLKYDPHRCVVLPGHYLIKAGFPAARGRDLWRNWAFSQEPDTQQEVPLWGYFCFFRSWTVLASLLGAGVS